MTKTFAYVSCAESREIHVFLLDSTSGEIHLRQRLSTTGSPLPLKVSPDQHVLYAGMRSENGLEAFGIDQNSGELIALGGIPAAGRPAYVTCDNRMNVAFSASYGDDLLEVFPLDGKGAPQAASQIEKDLPHAHAALTDASNRWLLAPILGADQIRVYRLEDSGRITPNDPAMTTVRSGSGPRHLVFSPDQRHVYCLNEVDSSIDAFDFDATAGTLTLKQSVSILPPDFAGKPWAAELRATPDGRFLYATERRASTIAAFAVDVQNGLLTLIDHIPTETQPRGMGIDASGQWLIAAGELSNRLTVYAIDTATGRLTARQNHPTGLDPICVEFVTLT